jgi:MFS family permease
LRFLREDAVAGAALAALCCFIVVGMTINIAEVFLVRDVLHAGAGWYGAVGTIYALGLLAGSSLTGRLARRWQSLRLVAPALAITAAACGGYALVPQVAWLIPLALAGGGATGVLNVCVGALVVGRSPEQLRGRVSAAMNAAISAATVLGLGAGAATTGVAAPRVAIGLSAAAAAVIAVVVGALIKRAHANGP